ncbi:hypothetical protein BGCPKDLD_5163 [Methylorubrum suomiense]|uniref:Transposase n=1 Tax=Methylorubrum suomiense TaxID=144191 RepID=A0ABQ4V2D4_9HYPH|nr:hypothetical protein BGCPKDLD_5163 [Methylorubrum suomiense]
MRFQPRAMPLQAKRTRSGVSGRMNGAENRW